MVIGLDAVSRRLYPRLLLGFATFGIVLTITGAAIPEILKGFGWSYTAMGIVLSASAVGYFLSTFLSGFLVQRMGSKSILVSALCLEAVCLALFARSPSAVLNFGLNFMIGICQGAVEVVSNLEVIRMEKRGQSRLMNLLHAAFSVGAVAGPIGVGALIGSGIGGVAVFPITGGVLLLMGLFFLTAPFPRDRGASKAETWSARVLGRPLLLLFTAILLFYVGSEIGVSSWLAEYFVKILGASPAIGAFSISLFWLGILAGRLATSQFYRGTRQELVLVFFALMSAAALGSALAFYSLIPVAFLVFLSGLGYSAIYPLVMALTGAHLKSGVAVGTVATGGGIGSFTFPLIFAVISQSRGLRSGFFFCVLINVAMICLALIAVGALRGRRGSGS
jgi:FHS family L-fucose permease-like MFS transporter